MPLTAVGPQAGDVEAAAADLTRARMLLGYRSRVDLIIGWRVVGSGCAGRPVVGAG